VAVWVFYELKSVCTNTRRKSRRSVVSSHDVDGLRAEDEASPSYEIEKRQRNHHTAIFLGALDPQLKAILEDSINKIPNDLTARKLGISIRYLRKYKSLGLKHLRQSVQIRKQREHLWSLLPLAFLPGADGDAVRRSLWGWLTRGTQAVGKAVALTVAVVVPITAYVTAQVVRSSSPGSTMGAPIAPALTPAVPSEPAPRYALPAEPPVAAEGDVMLAVARMPAAPSARVSTVTPRAGERAGEVAHREDLARRAIDAADAYLASNPRMALQQVQSAARLAPAVDAERRESRRCLGLQGLGRYPEATRCATTHLARWPSSIFAAQMRGVQSPP